MSLKQKSPVVTPSIYDRFTHQYKLSKTLRFELKPVGETKRFLQEHGVVEKDKKIDEAYEKLKPYIDELHRSFIHESLAPANVAHIDFSVYDAVLAEGKDGHAEQAKIEKILRAQILKVMDDVGTAWQKECAPEAKKTGIGFLLSADVLGLLAHRYPNEKKTFDAFKGFTTYLSKFQETRNNLYKDDGTATAVPTRIVENYSNYRSNTERVRKAMHRVRFKVDAYTHYFTQPDIEAYNKAVGEYNAAVKKLRDQVSKDNRNGYQLLKTLYNQILTEKKIEKDAFEVTDANLKDRYGEYTQEAERFYSDACKLISGHLTGIDPITITGIYLNNRTINTLSRRIFIDGYGIELALTDKKGKKAPENPKVKPFVAVAEVAMFCGEKKAEEVFKESCFRDDDGKQDPNRNELARNYFVTHLVREMTENMDTITRTSDTPLPTEASFMRGNEEHMRGLKAKLDAGLGIVQLMKYFVISGLKEANTPEVIDVEFYNALDELVGDLRTKHDLVKRYDALRNFFTKKIDAKDKVKLNFDSGMFLSGFDKNKEPEKLGLIFRKDGAYFIGILHKEHAKIFDDTKHASIFDVDGDVYEKMEYRLFPDPKRMIPKVAFAKSNLARLDTSDVILTIKKEYEKYQEFKKDDWSIRFEPGKLTMLIAYYQHALTALGYKDTFDLVWKEAREYATLGEFNDDIARQQYKVTFRTVLASHVDGQVAKGNLYLFRIHNKDFARTKNGCKKFKNNVHTEYFLNMFSPENLVKPIIKLSGNAEVFFRDQKLEIQKRKLGTGREIIEKKRYTEDKYLFHVPIELNTNAPAAPSKPFAFNTRLNTEVIAKYPMNVIGVDRGEKHLAYYSIVSPDGTIIETDSLNTIDKVNYHGKLTERAKIRQDQRRTWREIGMIKDLKKGYISQAVHRLVSLAIEYNAVIVLEDLNFRFKQVRGGIEKSVYQQLEKALIDKLGYLVFKDRVPAQAGGAMNAYQLASPIPAMKDVGKQTGIVFYTTAEYTSTTDPITGWRRRIYLKSNDTQERLRDAFTKQITLGWDNKLGSFTFAYDQKDFDKNLPPREWIMKAAVPRLVTYRDPKDQIWKTVEWNPNERIETLLRAWDFTEIEIYSEDISEIVARKYADKELGGKRKWRGENGKEEGFFQAFSFILKMVQQIRNTTTGEVTLYESGKPKTVSLEDDFIASPVAPYYMTKSNRFGEENTCGLDAITNGDALGAYNIARKGLMMIDRIKENIEKPELLIKRSDWDVWAQKHST